MNVVDASWYTFKQSKSINPFYGSCGTNKGTVYTLQLTFIPVLMRMHQNIPANDVTILVSGYIID